MTRNLKALGLALGVVFAMSAVAAQAAVATEGTFSWAGGTAKLTAETDEAAPSQVFTFTTKYGANVSATCNEVHAEAEVSGTGSSEVTAKEVVYSDSGIPNESECTGHLGEVEESAEVRLNGCDYRFHAGTTLAPAPMGETEGTVDIICPEGKVIEVQLGICLVKVPPQEGVGPVYYRTETTEPESVTIEALVGTTETAHNKALTYETEGFPCGKQTGENARHDGQYTGNVTATGLDAEGNHNKNVSVGAESTFSWDEGTTHLSGEADPGTPSQRFRIDPGPGKVEASFTCNELHAEVTGLSGTGGTDLTTEGIEYSDSGTTSEKGACTGHIGEAEPKVHVHINGCHYRFHVGVTLAEAPMGEAEGTADVVCSGENAIEVEAPGCFTTIGPQEGIGPVYYRTETTSPETTVTAEARIGEVPAAERDKAIAYSTSGVTCGNHASEANGEYTGTLTIKGIDESSNQTNVSVT
jgi:hypothetical protein